MKPDDWASLKYILSDLASATPGERALRISQLDLEPRLIRDLKELLSKDERSRDFMSVPAGGFSVNGDFPAALRCAA